MITNWFMVAAALLNLGAGAWYFYVGNWKLGTVMMCYALSSIMFAISK